MTITSGPEEVMQIIDFLSKLTPKEIFIRDFFKASPIWQNEAVNQYLKTKNVNKKKFEPVIRGKHKNINWGFPLLLNSLPRMKT